MTTSQAKNSPHTPFFNITQALRGQWSPLGLFLGIVFSVSLSANSSPSDATSFIGYRDENRDGVNDIYCDKNGDGINDVDGKEIFLKVKYEDNDNDNRNDLFIDEDGDGVNDVYLMSNSMPVIDNDNDKINDITGIKYKKGFYSGSLFGLAIEEKGLWLEDFRDDDSDFCDDEVKAEIIKDKNDVFKDEDGDGISDDRESVMNKRRYRSIFKRVIKKGKNK